MKFKYNVRIFELSRIEDLDTGMYEVEPFITKYSDSPGEYLITRIEVYDYKDGAKDVFLYKGKKIIWSWPDNNIQGIPEYVTVLDKE